MRLLQYCLFFIGFSLLALAAKAQTRLPVGAWKSHTVKNSSITLARVGSKIFSGVSFVKPEDPYLAKYGFFYYDIASGETKELSKVDHFSQTSVSKLGFSKATNTLVIAYENGQIDLLQDNKIQVMDDIRDFGITGSKGINHLNFYSNLVYISTDFGLVVYNLEKQETREIYQSFTNENTTWVAYASAVLKDSLFVSTSLGFYGTALASNVNKLDFKNWKKISTSLPNSGKPFTSIAPHGEKLFLANDNDLFTYSSGIWEMDTTLNKTIKANGNALNIVKLKTEGDKLWLLQPTHLFELENGILTQLSNLGELQSAFDVEEDESGKIWISDKAKGLVTNRFSKAFKPIELNGPAFSMVFRLGADRENLMLLSGGRSDYEQKELTLGFSYNKGGLYNNYNYLGGNLPPIRDLVVSVYNPITKKMYFGSYGNGVTEWDFGSNFKIMTDTTPGCPLVCNGDPKCKVTNYCRVNDLSVDAEGNVWAIAEQLANKGVMLYKYTPEGKWISYPWSGTDALSGYNFNRLDVAPHNYPRFVIVDKDNNKWISSRIEGGVFVFNENKRTLPRRLFYSKGTNEELCGAYVMSITSDLDGTVWIGTENGVCYFSNPSETLTKRSVKASVPVYENHALLKGQSVTAIAVDGGNRKWLGTQNQGVWLFSSDGTKLISHFDESNSPLPSNSIVDIKIVPATGEVFIATAKGLVSYGGGALLAEGASSQVLVYPNPATQDQSGPVSIAGLAKNALVKITDISGKLVYQTKAQGSLATWDLSDYTGRRAQPGVYLILASGEDGSEAIVSKLAVLD